MGKRIILLSDGTGNSAAKVWRTNVWRLFQSLDLRRSDQVAMYDDGVGTSSFKPMALLGGAFGFGLKRNVLGLYKFLCRNYKSEQDYEKLAEQQRAKSDGAEKPTDDLKDDEIFLFGFSRGAFTVRILTGLVLTQGLVHFNSESELSAALLGARVADDLVTAAFAADALVMALDLALFLLVFVMALDFLLLMRRSPEKPKGPVEGGPVGRVDG